MSSQHGDDRASNAVRGRALAGSFATSAAILVLGTVSGVLLARSLSPTNRGVLAAALLWPTIMAAVGTLGAMESATFHIARRTAPLGVLVGSGLCLVLVQAAVFTAAGAVVIPLALSSHPRALTYAFVFLGFIPLNIAALFLAGVLNGRHRYAEFQAVRLLVVLTSVALLATLAIAGRLTVRSAVLAYLAANALTLVVSAVLALRRIGPLRVERRQARALFGYGIRSHASTVSSQLNERLDQLVISIFLASRSLGIYVIALTMTSVTYLIGTSVAWVALPQLAPLPPGTDRTTLARRTLQLTLGLSVLVSAPVFILAGPLVGLLFGSAYDSAAGVTRILLAAVVLLGTNRVLEAILRAVGQPLDAGVAELIAIGATIAGLAVLLPLLGLDGAALASLLAYGVSTGWMSRRVSAHLGVSVSSLLAVHRDDLLWLRQTLARAVPRRFSP